MEFNSDHKVIEACGSKEDLEKLVSCSMENGNNFLAKKHPDLKLEKWQVLYSIYGLIETIKRAK